MHIALGILPIPCRTPARDRQDTDLLVVADSFCRHASGVGELTDRQRVFHDLSPFYKSQM
jgi:hypothetical protein